MKLKLLVQEDQTENLALKIHSSVMVDVRAYKLYYETALKGKVHQTYLIEEMLKLCMSEDKEFQKFLKSPVAPKNSAVADHNSAEPK